MLTELLVVVLLVVVGWSLWPAEDGGDANGVRLAMAFPLGCGAVVVVHSVLMAAGLTAATPRWSLAVAVVASVAMVLRRGGPLVPSWWLAAAVVLALVVIVGAANVLHVTSFTFDSFQHVSLAELLRESRLEEARPHVLKKRTLAVATLHGLADSGAVYLRAFGPMLATSTVALLWFASREELRRRAPAGMAFAATVVVPAAVCIAMIANNRMAWLAVYLNGHSLTAALALALAVLVRRVLVGRGAEASLVAVFVLVAATTLARTEGAFLALLLLAPAVVEQHVGLRWRSWAVAAVGVALVVFQGLTVGRMYIVAGTSVPMPVVGLVSLGLVLLHASAQLDRLEKAVTDAGLEARELLGAAMSLLVGAVVIATLIRPSISFVSIRETANNLLLTGNWGVSLVVLGGVVLIVIATIRVERIETLLFPLVAFVPLALLLAHLRGGPYRAGIGDSLNRMFGHVVPLALLLLAVHAGGVIRERWTDRSRRGVSAPN